MDTQTQAQNYDISKWLSQMSQINGMTKKQIKQHKQMVKWEGAIEAILRMERVAEFYNWGELKIKPIPFNTIQFTRFENNKPTHEGYFWNYETDFYDRIKLRNEVEKIKNEEKERKKKARERENTRITVKSFLGGESFEMKRVKLYQKRVEEEWRALKSKREQRRQKGIMSNYNKKKQKKRKR
mgnify:CR=1 FL=1